MWQSDPEAENEFRVEGDLIWIKLTQGKETCVDSGEWSRVKCYKWRARRCRSKFYAATTAPGTRGGILYLHRFLLPAPIEVDHKDRDGLNNRGTNLRSATVAQNQQNRKRGRDNTSGFRGVSWHRFSNHWRASIRVNKRQRHLGYFTEKQAAAQAYDEAAKKYFGGFASLNFS